MTEYIKITKHELYALKDVSDTCVGMTGGNPDDDSFDREARRGEKAINAILKRANLHRDITEYEYSIVI